MSWTAELPVRLPQPSKENSWEDNPIPSELPNRQSLGTKRRQAALKYPFQPFPANIEIAEDDITAIKFARAEYIPEYDFVESSKGQKMVLWSNSKSGGGNSRYGIGITYMQSGNRWVDLEYLIQRDVKDWVAEIAAISKALQIAAEEVFRAETKPKILVIYTGSRQALERLNKGIVGVVPGQKFLLKPGILAAENIRDSSVVVELRWGPDTELLQGSRRARHAARRAANYTPSRRQGDTVLEVQSITRQARARARTRFRPTAIVLPDDQISDLDLDKQELTVKYKQQLTGKARFSDLSKCYCHSTSTGLLQRQVGAPSGYQLKFPSRRGTHNSSTKSGQSLLPSRRETPERNSR